MDYKENDYELIYLINENNEEAKEIFYKKYSHLVELKAKKYYSYVKNSGIEYSDIVQEGMIGLSKAINSFKDEKNTLFSTYANKCIEMHLLSFIRSSTNLKNHILNNSISLDYEINSSGNTLKDFIKDKSNIDPEDIIIKEEKNLEIKEFSDKKFTPLERDVFNLRNKGLKYSEIAKELNITKKSAEHAMSRVRKKIEKIR